MSVSSVAARATTPAIFLAIVLVIAMGTLVPVSNAASSVAATTTTDADHVQLEEGASVESLSAGKVTVRDVSHKVDRKPTAQDDHADPATKSAEANSHAASASHPTPHAAAHGAHGTSVSAEQSLRWLQNGNTRYIKKRYRNDGKSDSDRSRLSDGQKPHAIVLSCSDSRVPPEIVFDQSLGEIFVVRVAGEALDSSVVASIEYAVEHLGSQLILVLGHSSCGAVKAAVGAKEGTSSGSPDLDKLVADIRPRLKVTMNESPSTNFEVESAVNADGVARDLVKRSSLIRKRVEAGNLTIKSALYRLNTGKVTFY